jgi:hypothetical protein
MEKRYALYADFYHKHEEVVTWEQAHKRLLKYYLSDLDENTVHDYINPDPSTFYQAYHNHIKRN